MSRTFTRNPLFILLFLLASFSTSAQFWMQNAGGLTVDEGYDIAVDGSGNTYSTGYFSGTVNFGSTSLTASGPTDIFVAKTDNQGEFVWAVKAGGSAGDRGLSIDIDGSGNVYVTGFFNGTASFGSQSVNSAGSQDAFIAKYNTSGVIQWVESVGGSSSDIGNGISVDNSGNVIVTGEFQGTATFGGTNLTSGGQADCFTVKLTSAGNVDWVEQGSGQNSVRGIDVGTDNSGNIYVTGQFSDTVTFDQTHNNGMFNVIFLIKYNSAGVEQWFNIIGGAPSNIVKAIATDGSGGSYLVGDFTGTVTFFGGGNPTLSGNYTNHVFLAKYNGSGALQWSESVSSESALTSTCIDIDGSGNSYIGGYFECRLDDYSDQYGKSNFMSVGKNDIFAAKYNGSGNFQYARNMGSRDEDYLFGISPSSSGLIHFTGSHKGGLNVPVSSNFIGANVGLWNDVSCNNNIGYCNDPDYHSYVQIPTAGNSDIVIANAIDPNREPYDFFFRSGSGCNKDVVPPCINSCADSAIACSNVNLVATSSICPDIGYNINWNWALGGSGSGNSQTYQSEGFKWVEQKSADGCFAPRDSIYVKILPQPDKPLISDDFVVNTNAVFTDPIKYCEPEIPITISANNLGNDSVVWYFENNTVIATNVDSVVVIEEGVYKVERYDSNGCNNENFVAIEIYEPLDSVDLRLDKNDTSYVCEGGGVNLFLYDTLTNPSASPALWDTANNFDQEVFWTITQPGVTEQGGFLKGYSFEDTTETGWYYIDVMLVRTNICDTDTAYLADSFYVEVLAKPVLPQYNMQIGGGPYFCPNDSVTLTASGTPSFLWLGPGVNNQTSASVTVAVEATYNVSYSEDDTLVYYIGLDTFVCTNSSGASETICVREFPQPEIEASSTLLCPNGTVQLSVSLPWNQNQPCSLSISQPPPALITTGYFLWEGPSGILPDSGSTVEVSESGQYYVTYMDTNGCNIASNTITINQYTTPQLFVQGDPILCVGDSVKLTVLSNPGSSINWINPAVGDTTEVFVNDSGTYTVEINSCNITTTASVDIFVSDVESDVVQQGILCRDSFAILKAKAGLATYQWSTGSTVDSTVVTDSGGYWVTVTDTNGCSAVTDTLFVDIPQVETLIDIDGYPVFCEGDTKQLFGNSNMNNYLWLPDSIRTQNIVVSQPGIYTLQTIDTNGCRGVSEPIELTNPPTYAPTAIGGPTNFCEGENVTLAATRIRGLEYYYWQPTGDSSRTIIVQDPGRYTVYTVDTFGCFAYSDTIEVTVQPREVLTPGSADTIICAGESVDLRANTNVGDIQWYGMEDSTRLHVGETFTTGPLYETTGYRVWAKHFVCASDVVNVLVEVKDCDEIVIPNVFSPNGDGQNDIWKTHLEDAACFTCEIYNRWGTLIYYYTSQESGWDGSVIVSGEHASDGVYFYIVEYCKWNAPDDVIQHRGHVTLIRNED